MGRATTIAVCLLAMLAGACGEQAAKQEEPAHSPPTASATVDHLTPGTLGQVSYAFDPELLTRAEVDLPLPPDFEDTAFAIKLIPADYADNLGTDSCSFETANGNAECTARLEVGLALALLERPIAFYRARFDEEPEPVRNLREASLAGATGFAVSLGEDDLVLDYTFLPVNDRTLLVAHHRLDKSEPGEAALEQVIAGLNLDISARN